MPSLPESITLTPATEADYPAVIDLANRAYRGTGPEASWNVENVIEGQRIDESLLRDDLAANSEAQLLLWLGEDGALLGCVRLEPIQQHELFPQHEPADAWYLSLLAVDPRRQNQQLGRILLAASEAFAQARGARRIRMSVLHVRDTLIAWYLRRGYTPTGETEPFPYGDERFGRPLRDDLHFVILEKELQS